MCGPSLIPLFALILPVALDAQTVGRLTGTVTDDNDRPLQGAMVKVLGSTPARAISINKADGSYALTGMRPGDYEIEFRAKGYDAQRKSVRIAADRTSILNARLTLEQPESVVGVPRALTEEKRVASTLPPSSESPAQPRPADPPSPPSSKSPAPKQESAGADAAASAPSLAEVPVADSPKGDAPRLGDTTSARGLGGILVNVIDENGKPLGGARLFLGDARKSIPALSDGSLGVERVVPGEYEVTLTAKGFQPEKRTVRVAANHVITLIVKLAEAADR